MLFVVHLLNETYDAMHSHNIDIHFCVLFPEMCLLGVMDSARVPRVVSVHWSTTLSVGPTAKHTRIPALPRNARKKFFFTFISN